MVVKNTTGEELALANTNWLLLEKLTKAGGIANVAISMIGEARGAKAANIILVKACKDIEKHVSLEDLQNTETTKKEKKGGSK